MDNRFANLFGLTEAQSIELLDKPLDQLSEDDSRYVAAAQLVNFPTQASIAALMRAIHNTDLSLDNRIVRRKCVESLGKLKAVEALGLISECLGEADHYTVENAVWSIGEIGTQDASILEAIAQLLEKPNQTYRAIIHTLAKLRAITALDRIRTFVSDSDPTIASAAISAVCQLSGDYSSIATVVETLQHSNVYARRLCIQDLVDAQYYAAIPQIARAPVSIVFRSRGIRMLAETGIPAGKISFADIEPFLSQVLRDHPQDLDLVHEYDAPPTLERLIEELYETDFGRSYLAIQTLLDRDRDAVGAALIDTFNARAIDDYGGHYHVIKLIGWLQYRPGWDILLTALKNPVPQFQKSRAAAAIALGEFGDVSIIPDLQACLETPIWDLKYVTLVTLNKLGDRSLLEKARSDAHWLVQAQANHLLNQTS